MITLITGGSGCGKSTYAESRMLSYSLPRVYVATMIPCGEDAARRIARHRQLRAGKGFETLEKGMDVGGLPLPEGASVLLECLGNLVANEMFEPDGAGENAEERCLDGIRSLARRAANLVIVTNEVGSDGREYGEGTERYMQIMGRLGCRIAEMADEVCEVVCGRPVWLKGGRA